MPGSTYRIRTISDIVPLQIDPCFSQPGLVLTTSLHGDIVRDCSTTPCPPPNGIVEIIDVVAILDKFKNAPTAPIKARCDIDPANLDGLVTITDITSALSAFGGEIYPFPPPSTPPCTP